MFRCLSCLLCLCLFLQGELYGFSGIENSNETFDTFSEILVSPKEDADLSSAIQAFQTIEEQGLFTDKINPERLWELPIGVRESKSSIEYSIVVTKAIFTPEYALINAYARVRTPQQGIDGGRKDLYFGAEGIKLSYKGKIIGDAHLSLLGDVHIPFNQNQWLLTLKGGTLHKGNGQTLNEKTYVSIDCDGIKELSLSGNIQISRNLLVPLDANGNMLAEQLGDKPQRVQGDFQIKTNDWNDLLVKVKLPAFAITSQTKNSDRGFFSFFINEAVLDLSDFRNAPEVVFPSYYFSEGYLVAGQESWRGLYVQSLSVGLPQEFKTKNHTDTPVVFQGQDLLIDSYGVSGSFSAENIFSIEQGITSQDQAWAYSLDTFSLDLAASKVVGAKLGGKIQLPFQNKEKENTFLSYTGMISEDDYLVSVKNMNQIDLDIWRAKASLLPSSSLEMKVKNKRFYPKAILHGTMQIQANASAQNTDTAKKQAYFQGITFQGLCLQTQSPLITVDYFGVKGEQKLMGFPVSVKNIGIEANENHAHLNMDISIGLQEERFSATGSVKIKGLISSENQRQTLRYDGFSIGELSLKNVDIGVAKVSGALQLMQNDPLYGDGFAARLVAQIPALGEAKVDVNAIFGYSDFRYWGFEGMVKDLTISTPLGLDIKGFTGGAFYHMLPDAQKSFLAKDKALVYKPDVSVGLALRAGVIGAIKKEEIAAFMASFSITTHANGGLADIGFVGEMSVMSNLSAFAAQPFAKMQEKFHSMLKNSHFINQIKKEPHLQAVLDVDSVSQTYPIEASSPSTIYGKMVMNYDFSNKIFHADAQMYINAAGGFIKGVGSGARAGWATIHLAPQQWYFYIGTPSDMVGLKIGVGKIYVESGSYFMVGSRIEQSPAPPVEVANILGISLNDIDYIKDLNALGEGKGFAFGSHFKFDTGDMTALFLYARFQAGFGADIMLKNYGETTCSNRGGKQIGIDGWYANGQAYAYLQGELGIKIKLFFIRKKIPIIKAGAATLLQVKAPNPFWLRGYLAGNYNLLGGMVKGRFRFKLEFGEECKLENESVLGGIKMITDLSPKKNDAQVDVFAVPQATFAFKVNEPFTIPEDDGDHTYKIVIDKFSVIDEQGQEIAGKIEYPKAGDIANFISEDIFPAQKKLKAIVQVSFLEKKEGLYQVLMVNGKKATETQESSFTTGTAPKSIPLHNIEYAYPVVEQKNYYPGEYDKGYIRLKRGQDYLFDDPQWETQITFINDKKTQSVALRYDSTQNELQFDMPNIDKSTLYQLKIIAKNRKKQGFQEHKVQVSTENQAIGDEQSEVLAQISTKKAQSISKNTQIERLSYTFRSSKYNTFSQKIKLQNYNTIRQYISTGLVALINKINTPEYFDLPELEGTKYTNGKPLIEPQALLDNRFAKKFKDLFYDSYPIEGLRLDREKENKEGIPPIKALPVLSSYITLLEQEDWNPTLKTIFPYKYDVFRYYSNDWYELVTKASNKYISSFSQAPAKIRELIGSSFGAIPLDTYSIKVQYVLPRGIKGSWAKVDYKLR